MKGYDIDNNNFTQKKTNTHNEYGLNFNKIYTDENNNDFNRFFNTRNNLNAHKNIKK